jgi:hypothetical protein
MKSFLLSIVAATMLWVGGAFTSTADAQYVSYGVGYGRGYYNYPRYARPYYGGGYYRAPYRSYYRGSPYYYGGYYSSPYYGGYYSRPYYSARPYYRSYY